MAINSPRTDATPQNFWGVVSDADRFEYFRIQRGEGAPDFQASEPRGFIASGDQFRQGRVTTMVCRHHLKSVFGALELLNSDPSSVIDLFCAQCVEEELAE